MPDMPVARTSCLGRSTTISPSLILSLEPRLPIPEDPVLRAAHARRSRFFLESLEFGHGGQQCPAFPGSQTQVTFSPGDGGLERKPTRSHAVLLGGLSQDLP